jgi:hypothetical protein
LKFGALDVPWRGPSPSCTLGDIHRKRWWHDMDLKTEFEKQISQMKAGLQMLRNGTLSPADRTDDGRLISRKNELNEHYERTIKPLELALSDLR